MAYLVVFSTAPTLKEARKLSNLLLNARLAACVNILPRLESHYLWKGKKEKAGECLLVVKTKASLFKRLEQALRKHHSYQVPEVIAVKVQAGSPPYLRWLSQETSP